jgi:tRNA(Ile)-lysidine synthase
MEVRVATQELVQPQADAVERFRIELDALIDPQAPVGIAVSGGPDSLALLALAAAARPGLVEAATVDHALRAESRSDADMVARVAKVLGVPHRTLTAEWAVRPQSAIQERARAERYKLLAAWAKARGLHGIVTAHHLDDQAETFMMRLARGAGVQGLAAMRSLAPVPGSDLPLLRPLLAWRRSELESVCNAFGLTPVDDPSNADAQFERVRVRQGISGAGWIDPRGVAASARNLAEADGALRWATTRAWERSVVQDGQAITFTPADTPCEIRRRIVIRAVSRLATEGQANELRGRVLDRVVGALARGGRATIRGVLCSGGREWRFSRAPARKLSR